VVFLSILSGASLMSQNTQQSPQRGTDLQSLPAVSDVDPLAQVATLKIVACPICRAVYVPSNEEQAATPGSTRLLETAFLEVCHFCFRCQRPACPQCWNPVHHTCASCSEEARLPFRTPVPSLQGLVFSPSTSIHDTRANQISFTCQRNGRFYTPEPAPVRSEPQEVPLQPAPTESEPITSAALPVLQTGHTVPAPTADEATLYPGWLQEVLGQKTGALAALPSADRGEQPGNPASNQADWPHLAPLTQQVTLPVQSAPMIQPTPKVVAQVSEKYTENAPEEDASGEEVSRFERIENVLIVITSILLLGVVLMIVLSISSAQINAVFLNFLHIDIRTEIAYLLQLR
jgi:hypothetical protein